MRGEMQDNPEPYETGMAMMEVLDQAVAQADMDLGDTPALTVWDLIRQPAAMKSLFELAGILYQSGLFKGLQDAKQSVAKIIAGLELGIPPVQALTNIDIIEGQITPSAASIAALVNRSGKYRYKVRTLEDDICIIDFFSKEFDGKMVHLGESKFTMQDALRAKLSNKGVWKQYPRNMLWARAMTNGVRWMCPDVFSGKVYTPEELGKDDKPRRLRKENKVSKDPL